MSEVKRFEMEKEYSLDINIVPTEYPDGSFVHYDDYAALQKQLSQRDAQIAALTAENVALIEAREDVYAAGYQHGHLNTADGIAFAPCVQDEFYGLALEVKSTYAETSATDAAANALRAEGVEMFGQWQRELASKAAGEVRCAYVGSVKDAITFANQLREGK